MTHNTFLDDLLVKLSMCLLFMYFKRHSIYKLFVYKQVISKWQKWEVYPVIFSIQIITYNMVQTSFSTIQYLIGFNPFIVK